MSFQIIVIDFCAHEGSSLSDCTALLMLRKKVNNFFNKRAIEWSEGEKEVKNDDRYIVSFLLLIQFLIYYYYLYYCVFGGFSMMYVSSRGNTTLHCVCE